MKNSKVLRFFLLLLSACASTRAMKHDSCHKMPDLRQQRQKAHLTAKHLQRTSSKPSARFERRHPSPLPTLSGKQRTLLLGLSLMMLVPTVVAAMPRWHSMIYEQSYYPVFEDETYGPCSKIADNSTLCCNILSNYQDGVECCVHPSSTVWSKACAQCNDVNCLPVSYCITYDIDGIIGDQAVYRPLNLTEEYMQANQQCKQTYRIAGEARALQKITRWVYDTTGPTFNHSFKTFDEAEEPHMLSALLPNKTTVECPVMGVFLRQSEDLPTFSAIVEDLFSKSQFKQRPIVIMDDSTCHEEIQRSIYPYTTIFRPKIYLTVSSLQKNSDELVKFYMAHEIHHIKQIIEGRPLSEMEADLAAILATRSACNAVYLVDTEHKEDIKISELPLITGKNIATLLEPISSIYPYPSKLARIAFNLIASRHHQGALEYLLGHVAKSPQGAS